MEFVAEVYQMAQSFLDEYPADEYPEILRKTDRPYACLLIDTHNDYYVGPRLARGVSVNHRTGKNVLSKQQFERKYRYSTLPYFDDILGIEEEKKSE